MSDVFDSDKKPGPRRIVRVFHPTVHSPDLDATEAWFANVFGCDSTSIAEMFRAAPPAPGYPTDYSTFTLIQDVLMDTVEPERFVLGGVQRYPSVLTPTLRTIGWYVENMDDLYRRFCEHGIRAMDLVDQVIEGDDPPDAPGGRLMFFSVPDDVGLRYQFFEEGPFPLDPRTTPDWELMPPAEADPLGVERCSHHTLLTTEPARALRLIVDVLGGEVVRETHNELLDTESVFARVGDAVLEYAVPAAGSTEAAALAADSPRDSYHSIFWKVRDLHRAERHLASKGITVRRRVDDMFITDPETSFGIPWGFTESSLFTGD